MPSLGRIFKIRSSWKLAYSQLKITVLYCGYAVKPPTSTGMFSCPGTRQIFSSGSVRKGEIIHLAGM